METLADTPLLCQPGDQQAIPTMDAPPAISYDPRLLLRTEPEAPRTPLHSAVSRRGERQTPRPHPAQPGLGFYLEYLPDSATFALWSMNSRVAPEWNRGPKGRIVEMLWSGGRGERREGGREHKREMRDFMSGHLPLDVRRIPGEDPNTSLF